MKDKSKAVSAWAEQGKNSTPEDMRTLQEEQKRAEDLARIESIKQVSRSKLATMLNQVVYVQDWTHPCLYIKEKHIQTAVSEFYPGLNLAIDKFYHYDEWETSLTDFKRKALNSAGIKYVVVTPDKDVSDIVAEIETQKVEKKG